MSPEAFTSHVRHYCQWAESGTHDSKTAHQVLLALMEGAPGLKTGSGQDRERGFPGLRDEIQSADYKRFADFPFQCYKPVFWPHEIDPEGPFTENIHEDFAHIYAELRHGLQAMDRGDTAYALRYWRESYFCHWGHHASSAVCAIEWHQGDIKNGEPGASPNGGPAASVGNSEATEGPPSVS